MLYEDQAGEFDERAGLPAEAAERVAGALLALTGGEARRWLEVGAGTGVLGIPLLRRPVGYAGFDRSPAMLDVFRRRAEAEGLSPLLTVADGNQGWPADDGAADAVLCSRTLHHLDGNHFAAEARRVLGGEGGWVLLGRVRRPRDSPKSVLRRWMRRLLADAGYRGRSHEASAEAVLSLLAEGGGEASGPHVAARWTVPHRPVASIESWEGKAGLAGREVPAEVKAKVLAELRARAAAEYGDPDRPVEQEESYELAAVRVAGG